MITEKASFRDPGGHIFYLNGEVCRQVNESFLPCYDQLMKSGLYDALVHEGILIPHMMLQTNPLVIKPEQIPFISYPHEWSFSQLKDAALVTLRVQTIALQYGMCLKDASVYNIQFYRGKPVLIDTLSLIPYNSYLPWGAYRQFCQHFLAPLALQANIDWRLKDLFLTHLDGIPLDLAARLLRKNCFFKMGLFIHIYLHNRFNTNGAVKNTNMQEPTQPILHAEALISSLKSAVESICWKLPKTAWQDYYNDDSYSVEGFTHKESIVENLLKIAQATSVWDLGCNDGHYSRLARRYSERVVSFDTDPVCIERFYLQHSDILPLMMNLSNPTPAFGWAAEERKSLASRGPADLILALAVMHHLHITAGIPLYQLATYISRLCSSLIIEFIPKEDHKFQKMIATHSADFSNYCEELFLMEFLKFFDLISRHPINHSKRIIFFFKKKEQ